MWNRNKISHNEVGKIGEETACKFLVKQGFDIIEQNYWKKWGEIDIIAKNKGILHFIEVKTVSRENIRQVSRETVEEYRPEENVHPKKLQRLSRVIQTYLLEHSLDDNWQFDVIAVFLDIKNREAKCRITENIIL